MRNVIYGLRCVCAACDSAKKTWIRYVGQAVDLDRRFKKHLSESKIGDAPSSRWIRKHGLDNIAVYVLEELEDQSLLNDHEIFWIAELDTYAPESKNGGLNLTRGGAHGLLGYTRPQETRDKIAAALTGHTVSEESILKMQKTRHDKNHQDGPPSRGICVFCFPDGARPKKNGAHVRHHLTQKVMWENCDACAALENTDGFITLAEHRENQKQKRRVGDELLSRQEAGRRGAQARWHQ